MNIKIKESILSYSQDKAPDHSLLQIMGCVLILAASDDSLFRQKQPKPLIIEIILKQRETLILNQGMGYQRDIYCTRMAVIIYNVFLSCMQSDVHSSFLFNLKKQR